MGLIFKNIFLLIIWIANSNAIAQCPLNLNENSIPTTENLLMYFPFDGTVDNLGSPVYSAVLEGAEYVDTDCGQGLSFDGEDDYVLVSPSVELLDDYTITAWVSPVEQTDWMSVFSVREQCSPTYRGYSNVQFGLGDYAVATLSNQLNFTTNCFTGSAGDRYTNLGISVVDLEPNFVALTVENNNTEDRIVTLYVNCEEFETIMTINFPTAVCFSAAREYLTIIGASSSIVGQTNTFNGIIDEVRVYEQRLNHQEILDVYYNCKTVTMGAEIYPYCEGDSAEITLYNTELNVSYRLFDITNGVFVGPAILGDCSTLVFSTGLVTDTTEFRIVATHTTSGCEINLDSIITVSPVVSEFFYDTTAFLCSGDSLLLNGTYIYTPGLYTDTISIGLYCDSIVATMVTFFDSYPVLFSVEDTVGCYPLTVSFTDETGLAGVIIDSWLWDFGDGGGIIEDGLYVWQIVFGDINSDSKYTYNGHVIVLL